MCPNAHAVLHYSEADLKGLLKEHIKHVHGYSAMLASQITACIDTKSERGAMALAMIAERERENPGTIASDARSI